MSECVAGSFSSSTSSKMTGLGMVNAQLAPAVVQQDEAHLVALLSEPVLLQKQDHFCFTLGNKRHRSIALYSCVVVAHTWLQPMLALVVMLVTGHNLRVE